MNATNRKIEALIAEAFDIAMAEIRRSARKIMRDHPRCKSFCMGMGSASFYDKDGEPIRDWGPLEYPQYLKDFDSMVNEWDSVLHMTGSPVKINGSEGKTITDW